MSLIKKSDVNNHLSAKRGKSFYPFGLHPGDRAPAAKGKAGETEVGTGIGVQPSHAASPETSPNAAAAGSVAVRTSAGKSGKGSW